MINPIDLKERIAISDAYTLEERDLILDALNFYLHHIKPEASFDYTSLPQRARGTRNAPPLMKAK